MKIKHNLNGNKVITVEKSDINGQRGFSIETLGNLPETHRQGIHYATKGEIFDFVSEFGTKRQKLILSTELKFTLRDIADKWLAGAVYWRELSAEDIEAITDLVGGHSHTKKRVKSCLTYDLKSFPSWWLERVSFDNGRWSYCAGQDYTFEMAQIRKGCK